MDNDIERWLLENSIDYLKDVELSSYTYFKTGGNAKYIICPDMDVLPSCIRFLNANNLRYKLIGETSNLMFLDNTEYGILISTRKLSSIHINQHTGAIVAECGVLLPDLSRFALLNSVTGFEGLEGIPGSVGAAVFMNAGAYDSEISDVLSSVDVLLLDGSMVSYSASELDFGYRQSVFRTSKSDQIIVRCYFNSAPGDRTSIYTKMSLFHAKRHKYQEFMYPTLGSLYSGSVYRLLSRKNKLFGLVATAYYLIFYKWKLFRRESPNHRKWLNDFAVKIFNIKYKNQPFSDKDMNTLINAGHSTDEILDYIRQLEDIIGEEVSLENEIVEKI